MCRTHKETKFFEERIVENCNPRRHFRTKGHQFHWSVKLSQLDLRKKNIVKILKYPQHERVNYKERILVLYDYVYRTR